MHKILRWLYKITLSIIGALKWCHLTSSSINKDQECKTTVGNADCNCDFKIIMSPTWLQQHQFEHKVYIFSRHKSASVQVHLPL